MIVVTERELSRSEEELVVGSYDKTSRGASRGEDGFQLGENIKRKIDRRVVAVEKTTGVLVGILGRRLLFRS